MSHSRALAARARKHVQDARPRYPVTRDEGDRIARAFYVASNQGDIAGPRSLLADAVVLTADGGGKSSAWRRPIVGLDHVVRLFEGLRRKLTREPPVLVEWVWIDGLPGYVSYERDGALQTTALEIEDGRIVSIFITRNPDKLNVATDMAASRHSDPVAKLRSASKTPGALCPAPMSFLDSDAMSRVRAGQTGRGPSSPIGARESAISGPT